jgi:hypothetical protein
MEGGLSLAELEEFPRFPPSGRVNGTRRLFGAPCLGGPSLAEGFALTQPAADPSPISARGTMSCIGFL